ncbi:MAG: 16S rRNA (uracil(1498)-N(3))-methyltransferase [Alphaproteobacteria bacterium]
MSNLPVTQYGKKPRIYIDAPLTPDSTIPLSQAQAHYFKNVLRRAEGSEIRIFNGQDGEWLATLTDIKKKSANARLIKQIREQPQNTPKTHLFFAPIKKARLDLLIEKAVELGATDIHAVTTDFTQNHHIKDERITAQIIEAAEQCECMSLPTWHGLNPLAQAINNFNGNIHWACERGDHTPLSGITPNGDTAFLIGPEGGFSDKEIQTLSQKQNLTPISLGSRILRAETAAFICLSHIALKNMPN